MKKALSHGLVFKTDVDLDDGATVAVINDSYRDFMWGVYSKLSWRHYRPIGQEPQPRKDGDGTDINVNETIDVSVFDRYRATPTYRPPGLLNWAKQYKADPATLTSSVMANDPATQVPD